jgi:hypothetical protein
VFVGILSVRDNFIPLCGIFCLDKNTCQTKQKIPKLTEQYRLIESSDDRKVRMVAAEVVLMGCMGVRISAQRNRFLGIPLALLSPPRQALGEVTVLPFLIQQHTVKRREEWSYNAMHSQLGLSSLL